MEHRPVITAARWMAALVSAACLAGCSTSKVSQTTTTTGATTTTTAPVESNLTVDGVRPGVLQAPFYPQVTVTQVSCGPAPSGGQYVRIDLPPGGSGTPANSVMSVATAVIVVPEAAVLIDPRYPQHTLYSEAMTTITTGPTGSLVLTLANIVSQGNNGATVEAGNVQINGGYQCPATQVPYPGT